MPILLKWGKMLTSSVCALTYCSMQHKGKQLRIMLMNFSKQYIWEVWHSSTNYKGLWRNTPTVKTVIIYGGERHHRFKRRSNHVFFHRKNKAVEIFELTRASLHSLSLACNSAQNVINVSSACAHAKKVFLFFDMLKAQGTFPIKFMSFAVTHRRNFWKTILSNDSWKRLARLF